MFYRHAPACTPANNLFPYSAPAHVQSITCFQYTSSGLVLRTNVPPIALLLPLPSASFLPPASRAVIARSRFIFGFRSLYAIQSLGVLLGGSWVVVSGVISPLVWFISIVTLLITPFITTHEPPSRGWGPGGLWLQSWKFEGLRFCFVFWFRVAGLGLRG